MNLIDPTNTELYKLAIHDAPYVLAAYAILWAALVGYATFILVRILKLTKHVELIEEAITKKG